MFFGAAPELERYLDDVLRRATAQGTRYVVLRLKRVRNPDVVCLERIEHFLHEAEKHGVTVLLAGVRPDFLAAIKNLHFLDRYPADTVYVEEDEDYSATLKAVRRVHELLAAEKAGRRRQMARNPARTRASARSFTISSDAAAPAAPPSRDQGVLRREKETA